MMMRMKCVTITSTRTELGCWVMMMMMLILIAGTTLVCGFVPSIRADSSWSSSLRRYSSNHDNGSATTTADSRPTTTRIWQEFWKQQQPAGVQKYYIKDMLQRRSNNSKDLVIVITGATGGLGRAMVQAVLEISAQSLVVAVDRDEHALEQLRQETLNNRIRTVVADFASFDSVSRAAQQVVEQLEGQPIDILVNNAGICYAFDDDDDDDNDNRHVESQDGYDLCFQINYLSHFLWTEKLMAQLNNNNGRIVSIASGLSWGVNGTGLVPTRLLEEDPPASRVLRRGDDNTWPRHVSMAYSHSKLAQIWHMAELNRRYNTRLAVCACPSWSATGIAATQEGRQALELLAFPTVPQNPQDELAGPALQSILNAMFLPANEMDPQIWTGGCFLGNANVLETLLPKTKDGRNHWVFGEWFDQHVMERVDVAREFAVLVILVLQRWFHSDLYFQPTSQESSNATGQALLWDWSRHVVSEWILEAPSTTLVSTESVRTSDSDIEDTDTLLLV